MAGTTTRLSLPYPQTADNNNVPSDMQALATALDNAAMYEQGAIGSIPAGTSKPNGYWYADTASGGHIYVNVGTGGARAYRRVPALDAGDDLTLPDGLTVTGAASAASLTVGTTPFTDLTNAYKPLPYERSGLIAGVAATRVLIPGTVSGISGAVPVPIDSQAAFYLDPAQFAISGRTTKYNVRARAVTNAVAPATTFTVGLYPVATWGGGSGANPTVASLGSVAAGSTAAFASPASGGPATPVSSGDFTAPSAGWFVLAVATSGATAANSVTTISAVIQVRQT